MPNELMFCVFVVQTGQLEPLLNKFTAEEERQMKRMLQRVDVLAKVISLILKRIKVHLLNNYENKYINTITEIFYCNQRTSTSKKSELKCLS